MSFSEKLKIVRKERNITQEQLAETLNVSRQAISKWESGVGYPETEKLLLLSKALDISLDFLMLNDLTEHDNQNKERPIVIIPSGTISIATFDNSSIVKCHVVKISKILFPSKSEPRYILLGVDKVTFWGEHTTILGWYELEEHIKEELKLISESITKGETIYTLKKAVMVKFSGIFGQAKLIEK